MFDTVRNNMDSPDSGIDLNLDNVLITENDPVFNTMDMNIGDFEENAAVKVISIELPVIKQEDIGNHCLDDIQIGKSEDTDNDENMNGVQEGAKDIQNPIKLHSYSATTNTQITSRHRRVARPSLRNAKAANSKVFKVKTDMGKFKATVSQKRKLYEMAPLNDPAAEKCRQNALNAKINRDRKKKQLQEAETEINKLRSENKELRFEAEEIREELAEARRELEELREQMKFNPSSILDLDAPEE